jgi:triphosphatase
VNAAAQAPDLDLILPPQEAPRLLRLPELAAHRTGHARGQAQELIWHDTAEGSLAAAGLILCERRRGRARAWRLMPLHAAVPGTLPAPLAEAAAPEEVSPPLPPGLLPIAAASMTLRRVDLAPACGVAALSVLEGRLRAVTGDRPFCRVVLHGAKTVTLALALAAALPLTAAPETLGTMALTLVGRGPPPAEPPLFTATQTVSEAFAILLARQAEVLLRLAPEAAGGEMTEPVHQMRVALRRLRSALALFRRAADGPELQELNSSLKNLSQYLGPARDWDVFAAGVGQALAEAFPGDRAVTRLLAAVARKRAESYARLRVYLDSPEFRALGIRLAWLPAARPWEEATNMPALAEPLGNFAAAALSRRLARVLEPGADLGALSPEALHDLRIQAKRLRYAAEFFAPLYPARAARRFIRRIAAVQDRLGHLNDGTVATQLLEALGGAERGHAAGLVRGFLAAGRPRAAARAARAWRRFRRMDPFWA